MSKLKKHKKKSSAKKTDKKQEKKQEKFFTPDYNGVMNKVEKDFKLGRLALDKDVRRSSSMSTGLLVVDMLFGNAGLIHGTWYTVFGKEQSAKSTMVTNFILTLAARDSIPLILYNDFEGSFAADYAANMYANKFKVEELFGKEDEKGEYILTPKIRYYSESVGEKFFDSFKALLNSLPDKIFYDNKWWYVYENTKINKKIVGDLYDSKLFSKHNRFYVPAQNGDPQVVAVIDSYPAMLTEHADESENGEGMADQARMFSSHLRKVKSKMRRKAAIVLGVNQLRQKPMVMYGSPDYEPGGEALKFYCMSEDTMLFTKNGMLTAKEVNQEKVNQIAGIQGLEKTAAFEYKGHSQLIKVKTRMGFTFKGKPDHAVLALRKGRTVSEYIKLKDLPKAGTGGYYVGVKVGANVWPDKNPNFSEYKEIYSSLYDNLSATVPYSLPTTMTKELAMVMGYLIGDGHVKNGIIFFSSVEKEQRTNFVNAFSASFNLDKKLLKKKESKKGVQLHHIRIADFLTYLGCGGKSSWQKEIPWSIRKSKKECVASFIRALFDCDGTASRKSIGYWSASPSLVKQVHLTLLNFGVIGDLHYNDNWYIHGYDKGGVGHGKVNGIKLYGERRRKFNEEIGFGLKRKSKQSSYIRKRISSNGTTTDIFPNVTTYKASLALGGITKKCVDILKKVKVKKEIKYFRYSKLYTNNWYTLAKNEISKENYRTSQERSSLHSQLDKLNTLVEFSKKENIFWDEVVEVSNHNERMATYDGLQPKTHTIITDGIVSHNSDVRLQMSPRAIPHGKGQIEEEHSLGGQGADRYRYIHMKTIKNKTATPYLEGWARLWISDPDGVAHGFDPVYDTFQYLKMTGQITGTMKKMAIKIGDLSIKKLDWLTFKRLILMKKKENAKLYKKLGIKKPVSLRTLCFKQVKTGEGEKLYYQHQKAKPVEEADG